MDREVVFKVVGEKVEIFRTEEELLEKYEMVKRCTATWLHDWLQNKPILKGLAGPFGDSGPLDNPKVVRYETYEVYDLLSR